MQKDTNNNHFCMLVNQSVRDLIQRRSCLSASDGDTTLKHY